MSYDDRMAHGGINFWGVVHGTKASSPSARPTRATSSTCRACSLISVPGQSAYNAASSQCGMTESLRMELSGRPQHRVLHDGASRRRQDQHRPQRPPRRDPHRPGTDPAAAFEKIARTTPDQAAQTILRAVERQATRRDRHRREDHRPAQPAPRRDLPRPLAFGARQAERTPPSRDERRSRFPALSSDFRLPPPTRIELLWRPESRRRVQVFDARQFVRRAGRQATDGRARRSSPT